MRLGCIWKYDAPANAQYRAIYPMLALQARGHEIIWCGSSGEPIPVERLRTCDLVHVYRASDQRLLKVLADLRSNGVAVTWDNDDDITTLPKESVTYRSFGGLRAERDFAWQARAMRQADLVTTTGPTLASKYFKAGGTPVEIVENYLPPEFLRGPGERHRGVVIGWLAGAEHLVDVKRLALRRTLREVLDADPAVRVVSVGIDLALGHERYRQWPNVAFIEIANTMRRFDIGLAPLADIPFNRCRSSIKVKEYAAAGVPWLASPVGPYAALGPREGGVLVPDDGWAGALTGLIASARRRRRLARAGLRWARSQVMEHNAHAWERTLEHALALPRPGRAPGHRTVPLPRTGSAGRHDSRG